MRRTAASDFSQVLEFPAAFAARARIHLLPDSVDLLPRDFAHLFLDPRHSVRSRLIAHAGAYARRYKRPRRGNGSTLASIRACMRSMSFEQEPA